MTTAKSDEPKDAAAPPVEVLIVDNDEPHAQVVAESLDRVGFRCRVATSGTQGAELLEELPFDVVITDLVMSDVDGQRATSPTPR
jgi:two-component system response regulator HydG